MPQDRDPVRDGRSFWRLLPCAGPLVLGEDTPAPSRRGLGSPPGSSAGAVPPLLPQPVAQRRGPGTLSTAAACRPRVSRSGALRAAPRLCGGGRAGASSSDPPPWVPAAGLGLRLRYPGVCAGASRCGAKPGPDKRLPAWPRLSASSPALRKRGLWPHAPGLNDPSCPQRERDRDRGGEHLCPPRH